MPTFGQKILDRWIRQRVAKTSWYHAFEVWPGIVTPGVRKLDASHFLDEAGVPADLCGKRALDIGTWDGALAFEMERRGASVMALDVQDPEQTGFNAAREIRQSRVRYVQASVYELSQVLTGRFDLIGYLGVFYHLTNPVKAFEEIDAVLEPEGQVLFEGECLRNYAETMDHEPVRGEFVEQAAASDLPLALCTPGMFKERPNWFIPNFACLRSWAAAARLEIVRHAFIESAEGRPFPAQRVWGVAIKMPLALSIIKVIQEGPTILVIGSGFTHQTAVNFFYTDSDKVMNAGGLDPAGTRMIAVTVHSPTLLSFTVPAGVRSGRAYVQAANPPFTDNVNSGTGPGGSFEFRAV